MKKKTRIIIGAVAVLVAVIAAVAGVLYYRDYQATYIVIDGEEYLRSVTSLDLSGKTLTEVGKLKELTNLESLDLRDTGISMAQYDGIQAALPDCYIHWSVPFQDGYCDNETVSLKLESLSEKDFSALAYLKNLETVTASGFQQAGHHSDHRSRSGRALRKSAVSAQGPDRLPQRHASFQRRTADP